MIITLENFEDFVPSRILYRGIDYYEGDCVTELTDNGHGNWTAIVEGTEDYNVEVDIARDGALSWSCDCPYDGSICKHVVATLLELRDHVSLPTVEPEDAECEDITPSQAASDDDELERMLRLVKLNDLTAFVRKRALADKAFRQELVDDIRAIYVTPATDGHWSETVQSDISDCIHATRTRYDYYDQVDWDKVEQKGKKILNQAEQLLQAGNPTATVQMAVALFVAIDEIADESIAYEEDADIGGVCERAEQLLLQAVGQSSVSPQCRKDALEAIQGLADSSSYLQDYDYCDFDDLLHKLSLKVLSGDEALQLIDTRIESTHQQWERERLVSQKIESLQRLGRTSDIQATIDKYIDLPGMRQLRIEQLIAAADYDQALRIIDQGIELAKKDNNHGIADDLLESKLKVYELTADTQGQIQVISELFARSHVNQIDYYKKLKSLVPQKQWKEKLNQLLADAGLNGSDWGKDVYYTILIKEKEYDRVFQVIKEQNWRLDLLNQYGKHLKETHSPQMIEIYQDDIRNYCELNVGEKHYYTIANSLRAMKRLNGGATVARKLAQELCTAYPRRRRMIEILTKV